MRFFLGAALCATLAVTAPVAAQDKPLFSIGAIADAQYALEPDSGERLYHTVPAKLSAAVEALNHQHLSFIVHLGDFIDRDWGSYDALLPIARQSVHPWRFVLGNHDFSVDDAHKPLVPGKLGMPARYYSFARHGWLFIVTDGNDLSSYAWPEGSPGHKLSMDAHAALYPDKPLWDGGLGDAQMRWLDDELTRADRQKLKVMLFDHFPVYPENPHNLWNAGAVIALLERHPSVKIWLDGHNHVGNYGLRAGIHYVNLKAMLDTEETAYARLDFFDDRVELRGSGRQEDRVLPLK